MNVGEGMWALVGDNVEEAGFYVAARLLTRNRDEIRTLDNGMT